MNRIKAAVLKWTLLSLLSASGLISAAQQRSEPCGFDFYYGKYRAEAEAAETVIQEGITGRNVLGKTSPVKIIPVVVHIIHNGGAENISDLQVQGQIDALNEDFRRKAGTNGEGRGVDTEIQFCLAKITPDGKCTNGIIRVQSDLTNHQTYQRSLLKQLSYWESTRYLNIYVVKSINNGSGTLGYAAFPGGPASEDGIVVRHDYFGRTGAASSVLGRTTTHEVGHWLGLYHTFQDSCGTDTCNSGDKVCDTPPVSGPNYSCNAVNSCRNEFPDENDQIENYMDYTPDYCKNIFTRGQKERMQATLNTIRSVISSPGNVTATGCDSGYVSPGCNVIAEFFVNSEVVCSGNKLRFIARELNQPVSFSWYFEGGIPAASSAVNPEISYSALGTYPVKLVVNGPIGSDSIIRTAFIRVVDAPAGISLPFSEGFEDITFPSNGVLIENNDNGVTWQRDTIARAYSGRASAKINNLINKNHGQSDALVLPAFNLSTFAGTPFLNFKWAYAKSDPTYSDELIVAASRDCGVNWTQIYRKTGDEMVTGPTQTTPYIPDSTTIWKTARVNLYVYKDYRNVLLKIINVTDGGNNLYVDHINVGAVNAGITEQENDPVQAIYPNPSNGEFNIEINSASREITNISISDVLGKQVSRDAFHVQVTAGNTLQVKSYLPAGLYLVSLQHSKGITTRKVIIR